MNDLFDKLINDQLSLSELKELRERFNASSDEELTTLLLSRDMRDADPEYISQEMIDETKSRIDSQLFGNTSQKKVKTFKRFMLIAASVLVPLIMIGTIWLYIGNSSNVETGMCTITTALNETSSLMLPDGTSVKINGNSTFSFPSAFKKDNREVSFNGEAYFEVAKDANVPFIIFTPTITVTVKGTAFNLLSRPGAKYSELSLDNGIVSMTRKNSEKIIDVAPKTKIIIDNATGEIIVKPIDSLQNSSSWTSKEIYFDNVTPEYLIDRLEQTYSTTLDPEIKGMIDENFIGALPSNDLDEALRILRRIYSK